MKKKVLIVIGIIILIFISYKLWGGKDKDQESTKVQKGEVTEELVLSGELKALEHAKLTFQSSGELSSVNVKEGEEVLKGEILAKLDTKVLYETYERAVSDLREAQASLDKVYDEVKGHDKDESLTQRETRTTAEVARDKAYRSLEIAKENLANGSIRAPFDGVVSQVTYPFSGINTTSTQTQIEIVNPKSMYFEVTADQTEVKDVKEAMTAVIILDAFSDETFEGTVSYVGITPKEGETGTVYKVNIGFSKSSLDSQKYRVGMSGDAKLILNKKEDVLYAPPSFINSDVKGKYVLVGPRKKKVYIETGIENDDKVEIVDELKEGDTLYD